MRRVNGEEVGGKDCNALALRVTAPESINRESLAAEGKLTGDCGERRRGGVLREAKGSVAACLSGANEACYFRCFAWGVYLFLCVCVARCRDAMRRCRIDIR